jgi:hypothetical protein
VAEGEDAAEPAEFSPEPAAKPVPPPPELAAGKKRKRQPAEAAEAADTAAPAPAAPAPGPAAAAAAPAAATFCYYTPDPALAALDARGRGGVPGKVIALEDPTCLAAGRRGRPS